MTSSTLNQHANDAADRSIIRQLIAKDWRIVKWPMLGYMLVAMTSLWLMSIENFGAYLTGGVVFMTMVIVIGIHFVFVTVVNEHKLNTLPFMLSLPITNAQHTRAKLTSCIAGFAGLWLLLFAGISVLLLSENHVPAGLFPFATIVMLEIFVTFVLILSVAIITGTELWTIIVMVVCNTGISLFMNFLGRFPGIAEHVQGPVAVWNATAFNFIVIEVVLIAVLVAITLFVQSRKRDLI